MSFYSYVVLDITITVRTLEGFSDVRRRSRPKSVQWLYCLEQHSYRTTYYTVVNIQCERVDTYAEDYFWSQGLHKQRNQKLNTYVKRK